MTFIDPEIWICVVIMYDKNVFMQLFFFNFLQMKWSHFCENVRVDSKVLRMAIQFEYCLFVCLFVCSFLFFLSFFLFFSLFSDNWIKRQNGERGPNVRYFRRFLFGMSPDVGLQLAFKFLVFTSNFKFLNWSKWILLSSRHSNSNFAHALFLFSPAEHAKSVFPACCNCPDLGRAVVSWAFWSWEPSLSSAATPESLDSSSYPIHFRPCGICWYYVTWTNRAMPSQFFASGPWTGVQGPLTTCNCKGSWFKKKKKKKKNRENCPPPLQTAKKIQPPFFCHENYESTHDRKACELNFINGKFVVIFSRPPLQGSKILRAPFLHQAPLTSVCKRSPNGKALSSRLVLQDSSSRVSYLVRVVTGSWSYLAPELGAKY